MTTETKHCRNCKSEFTIQPDDFAFYEKMGVPAATLCPDCRFKRRALFRNERTLYNRTCDLCKKSIVSMYNPKLPYTIYCQECYESDKWDPRSFAMEHDPQRPFFEQLKELFERVPKKTLYLTTGLGPNINSEYNNMTGGLKNCYLVFNTGHAEDSMYSRGMKEAREAVDVYYGVNVERCYEGINLEQSTGVLYGQNSVGNIDSAFMLNCSGCQSCFGCVNLRHKSYHFFNEPLSKEEYKKRVDEVMGSYSAMQEMRKKFDEFSLKFPRKENTKIGRAHV